MPSEIPNGAAVYREAHFRGLQPDPDLWIDQWADEYMRIPRDAGAAEPGQYRTARTPYAREPMRCLSPAHPCNHHAEGAGLGRKGHANAETWPACVLQGCAVSPVGFRVALAGMLALLLINAGGVWKVQDWRYGKQLAEQAGLHRDDLIAISNAAADQVRADQDKRLALEQRLAANDQTLHKELTDAQTNQARLRDRLATSDLRLSVLVDATDSAGGCPVPSGTATSGVVHGGTRARLDPAHAQRIVAITGDGDAGLIALAAYQAYVRELTR